MTEALLSARDFRQRVPRPLPRSTFWNWFNAGFLPKPDRKIGARWYWTETAVTQWIENYGKNHKDSAA